VIILVGIIYRIRFLNLTVELCVKVFAAQNFVVAGLEFSSSCPISLKQVIDEQHDCKWDFVHALSSDLVRKVSVERKLNEYLMLLFIWTSSGKYSCLLDVDQG